MGFDQSSFVVTFFFLILAFLLSGGLGSMIAGYALLEHLEILEWTNDFESMSQEIQDDFNFKKAMYTFLMYSGLVATIFGTVTVVFVFKWVRETFQN